MMDSSVVSLLIRMLTTFGFEYRDPQQGTPGYEVMNSVFQQEMTVHKALTFVFEHLVVKAELSGCCFNWSLALAYLIRLLGERVCILLTPETNGNKVSLAYESHGELLVVDIVEYIKGASSIDDISAIPFAKFIQPFGDSFILHDVDKSEGPLLDPQTGAIHSNTTPDQFMRKE
ncbi:MAG: hypothetical protein IJ215_00060 [Clostridia bacterium]|nr:hypothetical protein [Clostridia bacterium]